MDEIVNYYEILGLKVDCKNDEIKRNFKKLALRYHPDKFNQHSTGLIISAEYDQKFKQIETAYRILSDKTSRRKFDAEFSLMKANFPIVNEQITIDDIKIDDKSKEDGLAIYKYDCRCGGHYTMSSDLYENTINKFNEGLIASLILSCNTCSLYLRIVKNDKLKKMI